MSETKMWSMEKLKLDEKDLNKSWVIGLLGMIFSISMAMAWASNIPITIGNLLLPPISPMTKVNDPDWE